jgi:AraC-type DNA-binding domain-containing proteins
MSTLGAPSPMNALQSTLYTAAFALCVFSAGILRGKRRTPGWAVDYFTVFLAIEGAAFGLELLMGHEDAPAKSLWLGLRMTVSLLVAPCLWLAVKEIVEGARPSWRAIGRRQFWLIGAGVLLTLPLIETAHGGVTYVNPERPVSWLHARLIHGAMLGCIGIFAWQVPHYLLRCRKLLLKRVPQTRADVPELRRLQLALAIVCVTWVVGLGRTLHCAFIGHRLDFGPWFALVEVSVTVGAIYAIVRRADEPAVTAVVREEEAESGESAPAAEAKYARSALSTEMRERIKRKLERAMTEDRLYADSLLNLRSLSAALKEKAHYVSQVINQDFGASFYEFVNGRRIEEAKRRLRENPEQTVLEIALAVGFNAKSTFNTAFRQRTGMTPTEFRTAQKAA